MYLKLWINKHKHFQETRRKLWNNHFVSNNAKNSGFVFDWWIGSVHWYYFIANRLTCYFTAQTQIHGWATFQSVQRTWRATACMECVATWRNTRNLPAGQKHLLHVFLAGPHAPRTSQLRELLTSKPEPWLSLQEALTQETKSDTWISVIMVPSYSISLRETLFPEKIGWIGLWWSKQVQFFFSFLVATMVLLGPGVSMWISMHGLEGDVQSSLAQ